MNSIQNAQLASYKLMVTEAENNAPKVALIPVFQNKITRLKEIVGEIDGLAVEQSKNLSGITEDKNDLLELVIDYLIEVSGAVHSHAEQNGNKALQSLVNYKPTKVVKLDQHDVITAADIVLNEAQKIPELGNAGISREELNEFNEALNRLKASATNRREAGIDQSGSTKRIAELFAQAEDIKKNTLDRLAPQFQRKAPEFYSKYKTAANVIYRRAAKKANATPEAKA